MNNGNINSDLAEEEHPKTNSSSKFIVGDRFHEATDPHKVLSQVKCLIHQKQTVFQPLNFHKHKNSEANILIKVGATLNMKYENSLINSKLCQI